MVMFCANSETPTILQKNGNGEHMYCMAQMYLSVNHALLEKMQVLSRSAVSLEEPWTQ